MAIDIRQGRRLERRRRLMDTAAAPARSNRRSWPMRTAHLDDEQLEAWFRLHRDRIADVRTGALRRVAPWLPIIDLPANDNLSGGDD